MPDHAEPELIAVKLSLPDDTGVVLRGDQLAVVRKAAEASVVVVHAGAGYGKTTLVAAAARRLGWSAVWYRLDSLDRDPVRFAVRLAGAVRRRVPAFAPRMTDPGARLGHAPESAEERIGALVTALGRDVEAELHVVLDDYDEAGVAQEFNEALRFILANVPPRVHFLLLTRVEPALPLVRWRLDDRIAEIGEECLRFDGDQAERVIAAQLPGGPRLARRDVDRLVELTEGWPASMVLIGRALRFTDVATLEGALQRPRLRQDVFDYLAEEVFRRESEEVRVFLKRTCLLEYVTVSLANEVAGGDDADRLLAYLAHNRIFTYADADEASYRYHALFRNFLREKTRLEDGVDAYAALHHDTAAALDASGEHEQAIRLHLGEGDPEAAKLVLERLGQPAWDDCSTHTLRAVRDLLALRPGEDAWQLLLDGLLILREGRVEEPLTRFRAARDAFQRAGNGRGESRALNALYEGYFTLGDYTSALACAHESLDMWPDDDDQRRKTLVFLSAVLTYLGRWEELDEVLTRLETEELDLAALMETTGLRVVSACLRGRFREALEAAVRQQQSFREAMSKSNANSFLNILGLLQLYAGDYEAAGAALGRCLEEVRRFGQGPLEGSTLDNKGVLLAARGRLTEACAIFDQLADDTSLTLDLDTLSFALCHKGTTLRRAGEVGGACEALRRASAAAEEYGLSYQSSNARVNLAYAEALLEGPESDESIERLAAAGAEAAKRAFEFVARKSEFFAACLAFRRGDRDEALERLAAGVPRHLELGHVHFLSQELVAHPELARAFLEAERRPDVVMGVADAIAVHHAGRSLLVDLARCGPEHAAAALRAAAARRAGGHLPALLSLGRRHADPAVRTLAGSLQGEAGSADAVAFPELTGREREVLGLLANGLKNEAIAERLYLSPATVKTHVHRVLRKLGVEDRLQATLVYRERRGQ